MSCIVEKKVCTLVWCMYIYVYVYLCTLSGHIIYTCMYIWQNNCLSCIVEEYVCTFVVSTCMHICMCIPVYTLKSNYMSINIFSMLPATTNCCMFGCLFQWRIVRKYGMLKKIMLNSACLYVGMVKVNEANRQTDRQTDIFPCMLHHALKFQH